MRVAADAGNASGHRIAGHRAGGMPGPARGPGMNAMFAQGRQPGNRRSLCANRAHHRRIRCRNDKAGGPCRGAGQLRLLPIAWLRCRWSDRSPAAALSLRDTGSSNAVMAEACTAVPRAAASSSQMAATCSLALSTSSLTVSIWCCITSSFYCMHIQYRSNGQMFQFEVTLFHLLIEDGKRVLIRSCTCRPGVCRVHLEAFERPARIPCCGGK